MLDTDRKLNFNIAIVYGRNRYKDHRRLCQDLVREGRDNTSPWLIIGGINAVRSSSKSIGGSNQSPPWKNELDTMIRHAELDDLRACGQWLTWANKQENMPI